MSTLCLFLLSLGSFALLALCQFGHYRSAFGRAPSEQRAATLKYAGLLQLCIGAVAAIYLQGGYGIILYICLWIPAAFTVVMLLGKSARLLPTAAVAIVPALALLPFAV
ncbi:DUF3325 family protein [Shewanella sp. JM162201]|uniref:DUF3325 family protein n=1 Tax=Shewanella jiangmenensis TaxID=2837387 RepID=A0ABS5V486_9GAMM|nr:DUF3325 domain-containing protein [Shewanella jiangmenensis]MBT1445274.1 DUF3325 family protein [Shewanella jiangmenensis]